MGKELLSDSKILPDASYSPSNDGKKFTKEEKEKLKRRERKQRRKQNVKVRRAQGLLPEDGNAVQDLNPEKSNVEIEYVERDEYLLTGKYYEEFKNVFQYFATPKLEKFSQKQDYEDHYSNPDEGNNAGFDNDNDGAVKEQTKKSKEVKLSRKKRKQLKMLKVAQLKALVKRPDVVEAWDVTSPDPLMLVYLKSYKNTVPVPRHWCQKRKFLQNKRGILKPAFKLPSFIEATGIARLRDPLTDSDPGKVVKQKLKERMNPKLGKIDIDYEILHDAFFKHQSKPKMTIHGDIYYEGKEDEVKMKSYKPGKISDELRQALGISDFAPPPWIINMQRYGPPPSYPNLKIPGLNTPLPESGNYNFLYNKPLEDTKFAYDVFGRATLKDKEAEDENQKFENFLWGELLEEEEPEEIDEAPIENYGDTTQAPLSSKAETEIKSGTSSIISGLDTPNIDVRKQPLMGKPLPNMPPKLDGKTNPYDTSGKPLYQVLEQTQGNFGQGNIFGSSHGYMIPGMEEKDGAKNDPEGSNLDSRKKDINFKF